MDVYSFRQNGRLLHAFRGCDSSLQWGSQTLHSSDNVPRRAHTHIHSHTHARAHTCTCSKYTRTHWHNAHRRDERANLSNHQPRQAWGCIVPALVWRKRAGCACVCVCVCVCNFVWLFILFFFCLDSKVILPNITCTFPFGQFSQIKCITFNADAGWRGCMTGEFVVLVIVRCFGVKKRACVCVCVCVLERDDERKITVPCYFSLNCKVDVHSQSFTTFASPNSSAIRKQYDRSAEKSSA